MEKKTKVNKKINTIKKQAWTNLICGAVTLPMYFLILLPRTPLRRTMGDIFAVITLTIVAVLSIYSSGRKEKADELSTANMNRAGSISAVIPPCIIVAVGLFMQMRGNYIDKETFNITGENIIFFGIMIAIISMIVKNGVFLWLDRTPKAEEDE